MNIKMFVHRLAKRNLFPVILSLDTLVKGFLLERAIS